MADADFAADLASVIAGTASAEYREPARFFANTYPTRGLRDLLANVCRRLSGAGGETAAIFRLDTAYGGGSAVRGKTRENRQHHLRWKAGRP